MADFYTEQPLKSDNWSSNSKGFKTADYGGLFEGAGDLVKMAATAADQYYTGTIKEEANVAAQKLNDDYGNSSAVATEAGIDGTFTPAEIQQGANRLKLLKSATVAGTLKGSSYWAQAELISRQLKMRYPGHWEQVDGALSNVLGNKPGVALQRELQQEREKAATEADASAKQAQAARNRALEDAKTAGLPEVFVSEQQGKPIPTDEINRMVANKNAIRLSEDATLRDYSIKKQKRELVEEDVLSTSRGEATTKVTTLLNDVSSGLYRNAGEYRQFVDQIQSYKKAGQPVPPELEQQVGAAALAVEQQVNDLTNQIMLKYSADAPATKLKDNLSFLSEWTKNYIAGVREGDRALTGTNTAILKSLQDHDTWKFLMSSENDTIRKSAVLTRILGPQAEANYYVSQPAIQVERDEAMNKSMLNRSLLDGRPLKNNIKTLQEQRVRDPATFNAHVTSILDATTSPHIVPEIQKNAIESVYGQPNLNFLQEGVSAEQRHPMFLKLTSPQTIKVLKQNFDSGKISSFDFNKVISWTTTNAMYLMRDQAAEINAINTDRKSIKLRYDPATHLLKVDSKEYNPDASTFMGRSISILGENYQKGAGSAAVLRVDDILKNIKFLAIQTGENPDIIIPQMLAQAGIQIEFPGPTEGTTTAANETGGTKTGPEAVAGFLEDTLPAAIGDLANSFPVVGGALKSLNTGTLNPEQKRTKISKDLDALMGNFR